MRVFSFGPVVFASLLVYAAAAPAQKKEPDIIGFPGFGELSQRPLAPGADTSKPPEITEDTEIGGKKLAAWIKLLKDSHDESERERAIRMIAAYGTVARDLAAPVLMDRMGDPDMGVRCKVLILLSAMGVPDKDKLNLVKALARRLDVNKDPQVVSRYYAAVALARYTMDLKTASDAELENVINEVVSSARDERSWEIRTVCLRILGDVGRLRRKDTRPFNMAVHGLDDACADVRREAAETIYVLGPPDSDRDKSTTIGLLRLRCKSESELTEVKIWLVMALMSLDGFKNESLSLLTNYFGHPDPFVREQAINAMGALGTDAKPKIADLIAALDDKEAQVVYAAIIALANVGSMSDRVIEALNQVPKKPGNFPKPVAEALRNTAAEAVKYLKEGKSKGSGSGSGSGTGSSK